MADTEGAGPGQPGYKKPKKPGLVRWVRAAWEVPYHLVGAENLETGTIHGVERTWWAYVGLILGCIAWYIIIGVGTAGEKYVSTFADLLVKDVVWVIGLVVAFIVPVIPAVMLARTYPLGTPLGHGVRGASFPYQMAILFSLLANFVVGLSALRGAVSNLLSSG